MLMWRTPLACATVHDRIDTYFMKPILAALIFLAVSALAKPLEIYFIDVEGGKSTLIVSPSGQSLLLDAGYSNFSGRDSDRILTAAKLAHVKKIDFVLISHHHSDHEGGVPNLLERLQVGMFFDPGPTVDTTFEQVKANKAYEVAMAKEHRQVIKVGDTIPIKGIEVTVVTADGKHIDRAVQGKAEPNPFCTGIAPQVDEIAENARSVGIVVQLGKFRYADFGDLTWNKELELLCPENRVGKVDVYQTSHHGAESAKAIYALAPRVAIMDNGARKGGTPEGLRAVKASPGLEDLWQLHFSLAGAQDSNAPDTLIANVDEPCEGKYLKLTAEADGAFTIFNSRNKYTKVYFARHPI
jgi:beta-lactamase superfamily II metal-dependent hydrolase